MSRGASNTLTIVNARDLQPKKIAWRRRRDAPAFAAGNEKTAEAGFQ